MNQNTIHLTTCSTAETRQLGERLGQAADAGQIIGLMGDLGAGKTTFTQGLACGLGVTDAVTSPTFTLVNEYQGTRGLRLIHIDTYRLGDANTDAQAEAATLGLAEIFDEAMDDDPLGNLVAESETAGSVIVIEWVERVTSLLPDDYLLVELGYAASMPETRTITLSATGPESEALLTKEWVANKLCMSLPGS